MDYTSVDEIKDACPLIGSVTTITSATIARFAVAAEAIVNAKLSTLYTVPVSGAPVLAVISTDITVYRILRRVFTQEQMNKSAWVDSYKEADELLDKIASGEVALVLDDGTVVTESSAGQPWSNTLSYDQTLNEGPLENMQVDQLKLDLLP